MRGIALRLRWCLNSGLSSRGHFTRCMLSSVLLLLLLLLLPSMAIAVWRRQAWRGGAG